MTSASDIRSPDPPPPKYSHTLGLKSRSPILGAQLFLTPWLTLIFGWPLIGNTKKFINSNWWSCWCVAFTDFWQARRSECRIFQTKSLKLKIKRKNKTKLKLEIEFDVEDIKLVNWKLNFKKTWIALQIRMELDFNGKFNWKRQVEIYKLKTFPINVWLGWWTFFSCKFLIRPTRETCLTQSIRDSSIFGCTGEKGFHQLERFMFSTRQNQAFNSISWSHGISKQSINQSIDHTFKNTIQGYTIITKYFQKKPTKNQKSHREIASKK